MLLLSSMYVKEDVGHKYAASKNPTIFQFFFGILTPKETGFFLFVCFLNMG